LLDSSERTEVIRDPANLDVIEGDTAVFFCTFKGLRETTVKWENDKGEFLSNTPKYLIDYTYLPIHHKASFVRIIKFKCVDKSKIMK